MSTTQPRPTASYDVGGVKLPRPFRVRRIGHLGINCDRMDEQLDFYTKRLGLRVSDPINFGQRLPKEEQAKHPHHVGYFLRHGTDHHSFVLFPRSTYEAMAAMRGGRSDSRVTTNQITWQVGSLRETVDGGAYLEEHGAHVTRIGRDTPGSNWHVYPLGPEGFVNELYYGIEQIGWDGESKPEAMHQIKYMEAPPLPHRSESAEILAATAAGVDIASGYRTFETEDERYDVSGILLGRPFKVVRVGPIRLFLEDVAAAIPFYRDVLGLAVTEEVVWNGHRCVFLRANTEHHSIALYPTGVRDELGLRPDSKLFSTGFQVADYRQLRDAVEYFRYAGTTVRELPAELFPGIDYTAFVIDPDGNAVQLYYYMEQIGWDGKPRATAQRRDVAPGEWPESLDAMGDTFLGEAYLGPWG
jgi:catechol 2,3-dioxygenase-like lactoylglutathione lyase family enzyme